MNFKQSIIRFVAALAFFHPAMSHVSAGEASEVNLRFQTISVGQPIHDLFYLHGGQFRELVVTNGAVSRFRSYAGDRRLTFYLGDEGEDPASRRPVASVDLGENPDNVLLVFIPLPENRDSREFHVYKIDAAWEDWHSGDYLFFNLTGFTVAGLMGEKDARFILEPGAYGSVRPVVGEQVNERLRILVRDHSEWRMLYSSVWTLKPGRRALVFISQRDDAAADSIHVRRIYQPVGGKPE